jgi:hypothetical protein
VLELKHDGETPYEAHAREGGPKHRRSTTQEAKEPNNTHNGVVANHKIDVDNKERNKPARPPAKCVRAGENPSTEEEEKSKKRDLTTKSQEKKNTKDLEGTGRGGSPLSQIKENLGFFWIEGDKRVSGERANLSQL